jgi:hypothetical protein
MSLGLRLLDRMIWMDGGLYCYKLIGRSHAQARMLVKVYAEEAAGDCEMVVLVVVVR